MTTTAALVLALTLGSLKLDATQFQGPTKLQPINLPAIPKIEGKLQTTAKDADLAPPATGHSDTIKLAPARLEEAQMGRSFVTSGRGLKAMDPFESVSLPRLPSQIPAFKACARVASPDRTPTRVKVQVKLPSGGELTSASRSVWFDGEWADVVFEFPALKVDAPGVYKLVFSLDGSAVAELPLEIRSLKQAAEPSGR